MGVLTQQTGIGPNMFTALVPSDTVVLANAAAIRVTTAGNLVLRGVAPGSVDVTIPVVLNENFPIGNGVLVKLATTAAGIVMG